MRIPWPEYINFKGALAFAFALSLAEILLGTAPLFAICIFLFTMLSVLGVNLAGGMYTFSGTFIAMQSLQALLISQVAKVCFLQPADSNLKQPITTIAIYTVGQAMLALAALTARKLRLRNPILDSRTDAKYTMSMSITASGLGMIIALVVQIVGAQNGIEGGSVWSYLLQTGDILLMGILIGTAHILKTSGGKRSARWWTIIPLFFSTALGIANNSKQGIYAPFFLWLLVCAIYRFKFNKLQLVGIVATAAFGVIVVFPVVQYSRAYVREGDLVNRTKLVYSFMRDHPISEIRASYTADEELKEEDGHQGYYFYYGQDEQLLDRVSLISVEDAVVNYTVQTGQVGYDAFTQQFISMVPRMFLPDKDNYLKASIVNVLGRETGILGPGDFTTYIAFSLFAPTFYMGGWWAMTVLTFSVMALFFTVMDSFYGDARVTIYALIVIGNNLHGAAELILPATFGVMVHVCLIGAGVLWILRKASVVVHVFIQNYSWFEKSPTSIDPPQRKFVVQTLAGAPPVNATPFG